MNRAAARSIARRLPTPFLRCYARGKLMTDPAYEAVEKHLRARSQPLVDLGCGIGLLPFYLRECGISIPIVGIDHDVAKIAAAREVGRLYPQIDFRLGDVRAALAPGTSITAIDILHYFTDADQARIVENIAAAVPPGGVAIVRDCIRDGSLRYYMTAMQERFSRAIRWLEAERLNFPTRQAVVAPFQSRGFSVSVMPLWGWTPFNNYLFVFSRPASGTMNS